MFFLQVVAAADRPFARASSVHSYKFENASSFCGLCREEGFGFE